MINKKAAQKNLGGKEVDSVSDISTFDGRSGENIRSFFPSGQTCTASW